QNLVKESFRNIPAHETSSVFGDYYSSRSNIFVLHKQFLDGRDEVEDDQRCRKPISSRRPEVSGVTYTQSLTDALCKIQRGGPKPDFAGGPICSPLRHCLKCRSSGIVVSDTDCCTVGIGFKSQRRHMVVCKCIVPSRHRGTLNRHRAASPLVRLVEGEERWEASDHHRVFSL
ncbi:hypothetical protein TNCV_2037451, partial [Trichonephila clavipes]